MKTHDLTLTAMLVAITAALGVFPPITLPLISVPITAQSLGVMLAGGTLGAFRGSLSILIFLIFIAIGFPLLPSGGGGLSCLSWAVRRVLYRLGFFCVCNRIYDRTALASPELHYFFRHMHRRWHSADV